MTPKESRDRSPPVPRVAPDPRCLCGAFAARYSPSSGRSYCWRCSVVARADCTVATGDDTIGPGLLTLYIDRDGLARIDRDRMGGGVVCAECGHELYDHPELPGATFLTVLCDGSLAKL